MAIDLKNIVSVAGSGGLFKVIKTVPTGILVESIDLQKKRSVKGMERNKTSSLRDISIYTTDKGENLPLHDIMWRLYTEFSSNISNDLFDTSEKMRDLMNRIVPEYDPHRVHISDIKRIINWYNILIERCPELFVKTDAE